MGVSIENNGIAHFPEKTRESQLGFKKTLLLDESLNKLLPEHCKLKVSKIKDSDTEQQNQLDIAEATFNLADHVNVKQPKFTIQLDLVSESGQGNLTLVAQFLSKVDKND